MKHRILIKLAAALTALSMAFTAFASGSMYSLADDLPSPDLAVTEQGGAESEKTEKEKEDARKKLETQRAEFERSIKELEKRLAELSAESKETEEYIDTLDEKIGYLNEELTLLDSQINSYIEDIDALEAQISENQAQIDNLQAEVDAVQSKLDELNRLFEAKYEAYCLRMRAVYVSGTLSLFTALLTCDDISSFFTRYQMIKSVSKSDSALLVDIEEETQSILEQEADLNEKKASLDKMKSDLVEKKNGLQAKKNTLSAAQEEMARKKAVLSSDKAESDKLFAELTAKNGMYTEFRNEDAEVKKAVEKEISDLINGIIKPEDVTLGTTGERDETVATTYLYTDVHYNSDAVLNMTYPVPGHYSVSAGFPNYSNGSYHGGIDFPCPQGTNVVAAQSGVVILVRLLNNSYGHYVMIYHGTDSKGRTIVTLYGHNSKILVSTGDTVAKGQVIAKSGSTGNSTGPHCHFEIRISNKRTNPSNYLSK